MEVAKLPEFNSDDGNFNNPMFWFLFGDASVGADRGSNSKKNLKILQSWLRSEVKPNETRLVHGAIRTLDRMNEIFSARMNVEVVVDAQRKNGTRTVKTSLVVDKYFPQNHPVNQTFRQDRIKATVGKHYGPRMVDQLFGDGDSHAHFRVILDDEPYRDREKIVLLHCVLWRIFLDGDPILTDDYYVSAGSSVHSIGFDFEGGMATIFNSGEGIGQFHARFGGEYQCIVSWNPSPENLKLLRVIVAYIADVWTNSTTQFLYHMLITYCQFPSQETQQARAPDPKRLALGQISGSCAFWSTALWLRFAGGWSNVINDLRLNRCAALVAQVNNNKFPRVWTSIIDMMIRRTVFESSRKPLQSALRNIQFGIIAHHELGTSIKVPPHETGKLGPEVMWDEDSLPNLSDMMPTFPQGSFVAQCRWLSDLTGKFRDSGWDEKMFFKFGLWARTVKEIYAAALYRDTKSADDAFWLLSAVSSLTAYLSQQKDNAIPPRVLVSWRTSFVVVLTILIEMNIRLGFVWFTGWFCGKYLSTTKLVLTVLVPFFSLCVDNHLNIHARRKNFVHPIERSNRTMNKPGFVRFDFRTQPRLKYF